MSFYEDIGVPSNATAEEVREAYRLLVRLLHPDQFADAALKAAAEGQMRRFNEMEAVLTDPKRRRRYDAQLAARLAPQALAERNAPIIIQAPAARQVRSRFPLTSVAWGLAAMGCAGAILWVSGHEAMPLPQSDTRVHAAEAEHPPRSRFAGSWTWSRRGAHERAIDPTEFIETHITEHDGQLRGRYWSRYRVADGATSRSVNFEFAGQASDDVAELPLVGEGGARGQVRLRLLSEREMELAWTAPGVHGVSTGTAVLMRDQ